MWFDEYYYYLIVLIVGIFFLELIKNVWGIINIV